jgi:hypothetical protein
MSQKLTWPAQKWRALFLKVSRRTGVTAKATPGREDSSRTC